MAIPTSILKMNLTHAPYCCRKVQLTAQLLLKFSRDVMDSLFLHVGRRYRVVSLHNVPSTVIYPLYTNSQDLISVCLKITRRLHYLIKQITFTEDLIIKSAIGDVELLQKLFNLKATCYNGCALISEIRLKLQKPVRNGCNFVVYIHNLTVKCNVQLNKCITKFADKLFAQYDCKVILEILDEMFGHAKVH